MTPKQQLRRLSEIDYLKWIDIFRSRAMKYPPVRYEDLAQKHGISKQRAQEIYVKVCNFSLELIDEKMKEFGA